MYAFTPLKSNNCSLLHVHSTTLDHAQHDRLLDRDPGSRRDHVYGTHTHTHRVQGDAEPPCDSCIHSAHGDGNNVGFWNRN